MKTSEVMALFLWGWHMKYAGNAGDRRAEDQIVAAGEEAFLEWFRSEITTAEDRGYDMGKFYGYDQAYEGKGV